MTELVVTDSTCLIALERVDRLDLLPALFDSTLAPPEVQREFGTSLSWLKIVTPKDQPLIAALKMLVDDGEAEAIALASDLDCRIILDDKQARSVAKHLGLTVIGTVGILMKAKNSGIIPSLKSLLDEMESHGFYIGAALKEEAIRLAGE